MFFLSVFKKGFQHVAPLKKSKTNSFGGIEQHDIGRLLVGFFGLDAPRPLASEAVRPKIPTAASYRAV